MSATTFNIVVEQRADYSLELTITDDQDAPVVLVGYTAKAEIRQDWDKPLLTAFNVQITDAAQGTLLLTLTADQTKRLPPDGAKYDVLLKSQTGQHKRVMQGSIRVSPSVTRYEL